MIERRHFLGSAAGTAAFFAMHDLRSLAVQAGAAAQVQTGRAFWRSSSCPVRG